MSWLIINFNNNDFKIGVNIIRGFLVEKWRIVQYGLDIKASYSDIPDEVLYEITRYFASTHPNRGGKYLLGF